jgi:hypothetical protein
MSFCCFCGTKWDDHIKADSGKISRRERGDEISKERSAFFYERSGRVSESTPVLVVTVSFWSSLFEEDQNDVVEAWVPGTGGISALRRRLKKIRELIASRSYGESDWASRDVPQDWLDDSDRFSKIRVEVVRLGELRDEDGVMTSPDSLSPYASFRGVGFRDCWVDVRRLNL